MATLSIQDLPPETILECDDGRTMRVHEFRRRGLPSKYAVRVVQGTLFANDMRRSVAKSDSARRRRLRHVANAKGRPSR